MPAPLSKSELKHWRKLNQQWGAPVELRVPFCEKDDAKALGAFWDKCKRKWVATNDERELLRRWGPWGGPRPAPPVHEAWERVAAHVGISPIELLATHPDHWQHMVEVARHWSRATAQ